MKEIFEIIKELKEFTLAEIVTIVFFIITVAAVYNFVVAKAKTLGERKKEEKQNEKQGQEPKTITVQVNDNKTVINNYIVINNVCDLDVYELIKKQVEELESNK